MLYKLDLLGEGRIRRCPRGEVTGRIMDQYLSEDSVNVGLTRESGTIPHVVERIRFHYGSSIWSSTFGSNRFFRRQSVEKLPQTPSNLITEHPFSYLLMSSRIALSRLSTSLNRPHLNKLTQLSNSTSSKLISRNALASTPMARVSRSVPCFPLNSKQRRLASTNEGGGTMVSIFRRKGTALQTVDPLV